MGKLTAAASVAGVGSAGAGGIAIAHQLGAFGGGKSNGEKYSPWPNNSANTSLWLPLTLSEFEEKDGGKCIKEIFKGTSPTPKLSEAKKETSVSVSPIQSGTNPPVNSCLVVNRDKINNQKWKGNFRLLWALSSGNDAFAAYLTGEADGEKNMTFNGALYLFKKDGNNWKSEKKMEVKDKRLSSSDITTKFPKRGETFNHSDINSRFDQWWNFLNSDGSVKSETSESSLVDGNYWEWGSGSSHCGSNEQKSMKEWSPNLDDWWTNFFGSSSNPKISDAVKEVKGCWESSYKYDDGKNGGST